MPIHYFSEDTPFSFSESHSHKAWIELVVNKESKSLGDVNYIFCSDEYLLEINKQSLQHDFYTDIITFDNSEKEDLVSGDLFLSVDRIQENAKSLGISFSDELDRVMIHGILHLCGYSDSSQNEKKEIRKKEDVCLSLRSV